MGSWKPIKTAPKDGTPIQLEAADGSQETVVWSQWLSSWVVGLRAPNEGERFSLLDWEPTRWTPVID
jgi:hypothetical protein